MKLLILTQKVDANDDVLGFFVRWMDEFKKKVDKLSVICLEKGNGENENIPVYSLGKEKGASRVKYIKNFLKYIWVLRKEYDTVFVHMNEEYVLLGAFLWKLLGKKVLLWRNHPHGSFKTKIAICLADKVYCTSTFSFTAKYSKTEVMPAGIDTDYFCRVEKERPIGTLLYLGRISSIKKVHSIVKVIEDLEGRYTLSLYGDKVNKASEIEYFSKVKKDSAHLEEKRKVFFRGSVPNSGTKDVYNSFSILVNLTPTGSFDKVILEMMATEGLVLVSNKSFETIFPPYLKELLMVREEDTEDLKNKIIALTNLPEEKKKEIGYKLRKIVVEEHSLALLVQKIVC